MYNRMNQLSTSNSFLLTPKDVEKEIKSSSCISVTTVVKKSEVFTYEEK